MSGIEDASTTEYDPNTDSPVITLVSCPVDASPVGGTRLAGNLRIRVKQGTRAYEAYRKTTILEAFHCNYELNPDYRTRLEKCGLVVSGVDADGSVRIVELPLQWFFVATGFVPQYHSTPDSPHPLITAYLRAALGFKKLKASGGERPETIE